MPTKLDHQLSGILAKLVDRLQDLDIKDDKVQKLIADYLKLMEEK